MARIHLPNLVRRRRAILICDVSGMHNAQLINALLVKNPSNAKFLVYFHNVEWSNESTHKPKRLFRYSINNGARMLPMTNPNKTKPQRSNFLIDEASDSSRFNCSSNNRPCGITCRTETTFGKSLPSPRGTITPSKYSPRISSERMTSSRTSSANESIPELCSDRIRIYACRVVSLL